MRIFNSTLVCFLYFLFSGNVFAQRSLVAGLQLDFGPPLNHFAQNKNVLKSHLLSYQFQSAISLQYTFWERVGLEIGASQNIQKWRIKDKDFEQRHPGYVVDMRNKIYYYSCFGNIQMTQKIAPKTNIYLLGGYSLNFIGKKTITQSRLFVLDNENVTTTANYKPQTTSINTGIGFQFVGKKSVFDLGLKFNLGNEKFLQGGYQVEKEGNVLQEDEFSANGTFVGLSAKYGFVLYHRERKPKTPKAKPSPPPPIATNPPPTNPNQVAGRDLKITHSAVVKSKKVTVKVWDNETVDGDKISLNLNGKWILENYTLEKKQYTFQVELNQGRNIFVLHALNLGRISPNTAAIIIHDGIKETRITLESTLQTSGTIEVNYVP